MQVDKFVFFFEEGISQSTEVVGRENNDFDSDKSFEPL